MIDEGGSFPEPDRRYWRRRVNRHVRKARRAKTLLRWTGILLANLAAGGVLVVTVASVARHFATSDELAVREIAVVGTAHTTPDAVRTLLRPYLGRNLVELSLDEVAKTATRDPWVKDVSVKRILPGTLRVTVSERTPGALALLGGLVYAVDEGGYVMGPAGPDFPFDLPLLAGLDGYKGRDREAVLARGVAALLRLHEEFPTWARGVSEVDLSRSDRFLVTLVSGGPQILLDPEQIDRNLGAYLALQSTIARKVGDTSRVDLRWSRRISLLPAADRSATESE
jgi:cell division septal protein FtsQ